MKLSTIAGSAASAIALFLSAGPAAADQPAPSPTPTSVPAKLLDTIVTTAERRTTTIRAASRETYVVTSDDLAEFASPTLAQALSFVPGLFVKRNGAFGGVESLLARGASSEQTLVLIDGRPAGDADLGDFDLSSLAPDGVERIEVVEGGASTLYGSGAVGGVINIITKQAAGAPSASAYEQIGYEGATATGVSARGGDPRVLAASFDARSSHARDQFDYPAFLTIPSGTRTDDDAKAQDVTLSLGHDFGSVHGSLSLNDDTNDVGAPGDLEFCAAPPNNAFCPSGLARQQRDWGRSEADFEWQGGSNDITIQGYADGRRLHFYDPAPPFGFDTFTSLATRGASVRDVVTAGRSNTIVAGFDTRGDRATFGASFYAAPTIASDATTAWYVEDDIHAPGSPTGLSFGLRREHPQGVAAVTVPSVGVTEELSGGGALRANYARSFRSPTLDERYFPNFGTPTLQPEYGATFDVGASEPAGRGLASLTYFGTDTNNLIIDVPIDNFGDVAPENVASARVRGFDASLREPFGAGFAVSASYTDYTEARDLTMDKRLLYRPTATAALRVERDRTRTSYGVDVDYTGQRYADEKNTVLLPSFASLGGFGRMSLGGGSSVMLRLDNLTGERVPESYGYPVLGPTMSLTFTQTWR
ncbi:MAG TPA: TonB-dependent receptor [Candidatus Eremiobacteraceae bacterium]|nr:TonB-dependent receptor [Candidatus Eremiobacteraceae bacterium]